jgi:hypothetical protein
LEEIGPGVYHWKAVHPRIKVEVSSYYVADSGTLIDPMVPPEGLQWFRGRSSPERIVLTNRHHYRQSDEIRAAFGCRVLCHQAGLHEFDGGPEVEGFQFGDRLAPQITAHEVGVICPEESALHIELGDGMLSFADGLIRHEQLGFVSDRLLGDDPESIKSGLRASLRRLLDHAFDALLFAHGAPLMSGANDALRRFVDGGPASGPQ